MIPFLPSKRFLYLTFIVSSGSKLGTLKIPILRAVDFTEVRSKIQNMELIRGFFGNAGVLHSKGNLKNVDQVLDYNVT